MASWYDDGMNPCLSHALSCLKKEGLQLKKEQVEAISLVSSGKDVFGCRQDSVSLYAISLPFVFDYKLGETNAPI